VLETKGQRRINGLAPLYGLHVGQALLRVELYARLAHLVGGDRRCQQDNHEPCPEPAVRLGVEDFVDAVDAGAIGERLETMLEVHRHVYCKPTKYDSKEENVFNWHKRMFWIFYNYT